MYKVSVCVLVYNHVNVIESTLRTILDQRFNDFEILVSDDCSNDGTWEVIKTIESMEPRVRAVRTPTNLGMAGNSNFAVRETTGKYIALLHHDDLYRDDLLEKWACVLDGHHDVGFVFNEYGLENSDEDLSEPIPNGRIDGPWLLEKFLFPRWGCPIRGTAMIRRDAWERIGGMREEFGLLADIDMWMRLSTDGAVGYVNEPLIVVRHARPESYPDIYKGSHWSWKRLVYLYLIHGVNREMYFKGRGWRGMIAMEYFRFRLSLETAKWIAYAIVRRKHEMLKTCDESETRFDILALRGFRAAVALATKSILK